MLLHHVLVPKLAEHRVIEYDPREGRVRYRASAEMESLLNKVQELEDDWGIMSFLARKMVRRINAINVPMPTDDPQDGYNYSYSPGDPGQPSVAIVNAIAEVTDVDFRDLKPLHSAVDTEFLNKLFEETGGMFYRSGSGSADSAVSITFPYEGYEVTVEEGAIHIEPT